MEPNWDDLYEEQRDIKDLEEKETWRCFHCGEFFEEDDIDLVNGHWMCRMCEDNLKRGEEINGEKELLRNKGV